MKVWLGKETQTKLAAEGLSIPMVKGTAEGDPESFLQSPGCGGELFGLDLRSDGSAPWARDGSHL